MPDLTTCRVPSCDRLATGSKRDGLCGRHYARLRKHGDPEGGGAERHPAGSVQCSVETCEKPAVVHGMCKPHDERNRHHGDPLGGKPLGRQVCKVDACEDYVRARGWCGFHDRRNSEYGDPLGGPPRQVQRTGAICSIEGCGRRHTARGWCATHFARWQKYGDAERHPDHELTDEQYFWRYVDTSAGPDACWPWTGYRLKNYGYFKRNGVHIRTHVFAWELHNGRSVPDGLMVRHRCDNPPCCNAAAHLLVGTALENRRDAVERNRVPLGEQMHNASLTDEQVLRIRAALTGEFGEQRQIAAAFGVGEGVISALKLRKTYKHI